MRRIPPPALFLKMDEEALETQATTYIASLSEHPIMKGRGPQYVRKYDTRDLITKADVLNATWSYMVGLITFLLKQRYECCAIRNLNGDPFTEFSFGVPPSRRSIPSRYVASIVFAKRGLLDAKEFRPAFKDRSEVRTTKDLLWEQNKESLLEANAEVLGMVLKWFAKERKCRFVGIFDWDTLVLIEFPDPISKLEGNYYPKALVLDSSERHLFRRRLFGFFLAAFEAAGMSPAK